MDYRITPIAVNGFADADGVYENLFGAWLGEVDWQNDKQIVMPYADEDRDYIPAPENWREFIIEVL